MRHVFLCCMTKGAKWGLTLPNLKKKVVFGLAERAYAGIGFLPKILVLFSSGAEGLPKYLI